MKLSGGGGEHYLKSENDVPYHVCSVSIAWSLMTTKRKHQLYDNFSISLNTGAEIIEPDESEKLLGGYISNDFTWNTHIRDGEKPLYKILTSRINALAKVSRISSFKHRKMIANGVFMSHVMYLIQLWGGCSEYLLDMLQVLQNRGPQDL